MISVLYVCLVPILILASAVHNGVNNVYVIYVYIIYVYVNYQTNKYSLVLARG
jgi:hypothetical protein